MFYNCSELSVLDFSNFNSSCIKDNNFTFYGLPKNGTLKHN